MKYVEERKDEDTKTKSEFLTKSAEERNDEENIIFVFCFDESSSIDIPNSQ